MSARLRRTAIGVLVVIMIALLLASPLLYDFALNSHRERVYWDTGELRYDYRWPRWDDDAVVFQEYRRDGRPGASCSQRSVSAGTVVAWAMSEESGEVEVFIFPGSSQKPDLITVEKVGVQLPTKEMLELGVDRAKAMGLDPKVINAVGSFTD